MKTLWIVGAIVLGIVGFGKTNGAGVAAEGNGGKDIKIQESVRSADVFFAYKDNAAAADTAYLGKTFEFSALATQVGKTKDGKGFYIFYSPYQPVDKTGVLFTFPLTEAARLSDVDPTDFGGKNIVAIVGKIDSFDRSKRLLKVVDCKLIRAGK